MKGLDTPLLVSLLRGESRGRRLVKKLGGEELCTTVINGFELEAVARADPPRGRDHRVAAIQRLRRKVALLGVDARAAEIAAQYAAKHPEVRTPSLNWLILGALEANGCREWYTTAESRFPTTSRSVRVTLVD